MVAELTRADVHNTCRFRAMTLSTSPRSTPTRCQAVTQLSHSDGAERLRRLACTAGQLVLIVETRVSKKERNRGPCLLQRSIVTEPSITPAPATSCPTFGMHPCWCVPAASLWTANCMASSSVGVGHSDAKCLSARSRQLCKQKPMSTQRRSWWLLM